jgi:hypothetical protein
VTTLLWLFPAAMLALAFYPWRPVGCDGRWIDRVVYRNLCVQRWAIQIGKVTPAMRAERRSPPITLWVQEGPYPITITLKV